jgi:hypothetical protein
MHIIPCIGQDRGSQRFGAGRLVAGRRTFEVKGFVALELGASAIRKHSLINNRQGGRRRGRGGQRPQGMSGSGGGNRQDNRQRGNAAQLLEKYKSLARDAQLGGDRVQTEYYLQFADHYFRVLGESRSRFDEPRGRGRDEDSDGDEQDDSELVDAEADAEVEAEPAERPQRRPRADREERFDRPSRRTNGLPREQRAEAEVDERIAFDALPPAIGADEVVQPAEEEAPPPRRRARRPRTEDGEADIAPAA